MNLELSEYGVAFILGSLTFNNNILLFAVLDVGAAPGAWTEFLSKSVSHVVAVDPGKLDRNLLREGVTHICKKVWCLRWIYLKFRCNLRTYILSAKKMIKLDLCIGTRCNHGPEIMDKR